MAAVAGPVTPQRPLPGAYLATPAPAPSIFTQNAQTLRNQPPPEPSGTSTTVQTISPVERAARTINDTLAAEARFPELESYVMQGVSGQYKFRSAAWNPFQQLKTYDLPPRILEQANQGSVRLEVGMFAPLGHAWAAVDNCLYLWDYTMPNPDLIGFEENNHPIEKVKLVRPKPGVFVKEITHLIVVATSVEMLLLGVASSTTPTGAKTIALYNTRMSVSTKGLGVKSIEASKISGRIFFAGSFSDDIYEFNYQQEEGWFSSRTQRVCHTQRGFYGADANFKAITQYFGPQQRANTYRQIAIDDTRNLMYTLSETNEIKVWLIRDSLTQQLSRTFAGLLQSTGHFNSRTELLTGRDVNIVSLSPIPASEANKLSIMATTNTGCRLYMSVTRGYGEKADAQNPPSSIQILHIRFPPPDPRGPSSQQQPGVQSTALSKPAQGGFDTNSRLLELTRAAYRFPPGLFFAFKPDEERTGRDKIFCSATDMAELKNPEVDNGQTPTARFNEFGQWISLPSQFLQIENMTDDLGATRTPVGFGNEMAVQFDRPALELGIMTTTGIQTIRRRRVVDVFAALMRHAAADDQGLEKDVIECINTYGRTEVAATALAVACGQGIEVTPDYRVASVTDPDVLEKARQVFIKHGGVPDSNRNAVVEGVSAIDTVRPSPRHGGLALYVSRLVRSIWRAPILIEIQMPGQPAMVNPGVPITKLKSVQRDLTELRRLLESNKSSIEGLSGPQALNRVGSRQEEILLQAEHRAMNSMVQLVNNIIEGISFVLTLFEERVEEILALLAEESRRRARELSFEGLFASGAGRELAKELVKAIVNRNIANGSNVDTIAEALRRRCGSFCSADDVVIFKAQEQVKRASEAGAHSESGRVLLNESQKLFQKVASSLSMEHLRWAVEQYVQMQFFAGAVQLCLVVAQQKDRALRALSWLRDECPEGDDRKAAFESRKRCYELAFAVIQELDKSTESAPETLDGQYTVAARRRAEAYDIVNGSDDAVFQTCLYDWYVSIGQADRLLEITSPFVADYLRRRSQEDRNAADLLWRYFAHGNRYLEAAAVQLDLAKGFFDLSLEERIAYLSRARTNASTRQAVLSESRQGKQQLLREIDDLLEVANIQDDILQRMKSDPRLTAERRPEVLAGLDGKIFSIGELFNQYADQAGYHDICLLIYQVADHRNPADVRASWQALIEQTDREAQALYGRDARPWEAVGAKVRDLGKRVSLADATFPVEILLPMLERYAIEPHTQKPPGTWAVDVFVELEVPHETLLPVLDRLYWSNEHPFVGTKRRIIAGHTVYLLRLWMKDSLRRGERSVFGGEDNAELVQSVLGGLLKGDMLVGSDRQDAELLVNEIARLLR